MACNGNGGSSVQPKQQALSTSAKAELSKLASERPSDVIATAAISQVGT
jgi:hypothetical protein